jgi:hypothetical protein
VPESVAFIRSFMGALVMHGLVSFSLVEGHYLLASSAFFSYRLQDQIAGRHLLWHVCRAIVSVDLTPAKAAKVEIDDVGSERLFNQSQALAGFSVALGGTKDRKQRSGWPDADVP